MLHKRAIGGAKLQGLSAAVIHQADSIIVESIYTHKKGDVSTIENKKTKATTAKKTNALHSECVEHPSSLESSKSAPLQNSAGLTFLILSATALGILFGIAFQKKAVVR